MRGFAFGSLVLIIGYAVLQPGAADAATVGGNALVQLLRRGLSPSVAGVPQRKGAKTSGTAASSSTSTGTTAVSQPAGVAPTTGNLTLSA
jgi:hypothetical protein